MCVGQFLCNNYKQALEILSGEAAFNKLMRDQNIANVGVFDEWLSEERLYLLNLQREPLPETLVMEYWQKLVNLGASEYVFLLTSL